MEGLQTCSAGSGRVSGTRSSQWHEVATLSKGGLPAGHLPLVVRAVHFKPTFGQARDASVRHCTSSGSSGPVAPPVAPLKTYML